MYHWFILLLLTVRLITLSRCQTGILGGTCLSTSPSCLTVNSICLNGICQCQAGFQALNGNCQSFSSNGCPTGTTPYSNPSTGLIATCQSGGGGISCPAGYGCTRSTTTNQFICCGTPSASATCPAGYAAYVNPSTGQVQPCNTVNPICPTNYICTSNAGSQSICCRSTSSNNNQYCPAPSQPYVTSTGQIQFCSAQNTICPAGYTCRLYLGRYVCCTTVNQNTGTCPAGSTPYINPSTGTFQICNNGGFCPTGYTCQLSGNLYICCTNSGSSACPTGTTAYVNPSTGLVQSCTAATASVCPSGYTCNMQINRCCSDSTISNGNQVFFYYCPAGMLPYTSPSTGLPQSCSPTNAGTACLTGFTCQLTNGAYTCCSSSSTTTTRVCPNGASPYINPSTNLAVTCLAIGVQSNCPAGYICTSTTNGLACCAQSVAPTLRCPNGQSPYINPSTNLVQTCIVAGVQSSCPFGYICTSITNSLVCCRQSTLQQCPNGQSPYINPTTNIALNCFANGQQSNCPFGYICNSAVNGLVCCQQTVQQCPNGLSPHTNPTTNLVLNCFAIRQQSNCPSGYICTSITNSLVCCRQSTLQQCPNGQSPYINPTTNLALNCFANGQQSNCPFGYICTSVVNGLTCCRQTVQQCPNGQSPYVNLTTNLALNCFANGQQSNCPFGYICTSAVNGLVCCQQTVQQCLNGLSPYINPATNILLNCFVIGQQSNCPFGYICTSTASGLVCCGQSVTPTLQCPNGQQAYISGITGQAQVCNTASNPGCPLGYQCTLAPAASTYLCCAINNPTSGFCPTGSQAQMSGIAAQTCSTTQNRCQGGYFCYYRMNGLTFGYCCSGTTGSTFCPIGSTALFNQFNQQPQTCITVQPTACTGVYTCVYSNTFGLAYCCASVALLSSPSNSLNDSSVVQSKNPLLQQTNEVETTTGTPTRGRVMLTEAQNKSMTYNVTTKSPELESGDGLLLHRPCVGRRCEIENSFCTVGNQCSCLEGYLTFFNRCIESDISTVVRGLLWELLEPAIKPVSNRSKIS